jgi:tRNA pseudouridine55 synthase
MTLSNARQKHIQKLKVKMGHGGTLDPLATGVLIIGVGKGTKCLGRFLECTKSYECVVLFGAATDSYDAVGKVVSRAEYGHVTKELVEEKLAQFRGKIMQKPSIFSALKVDGKKMYEYARAGGEVPEVAARPVEVQELELVEWLEPGKHEFKWPEEEVGSEEKIGAERLMGIREQDARKSRGRKRSRSPESDDGTIKNKENLPKKPRTDSEPTMSGALPVEDTEADVEPTETSKAEATTTDGEPTENSELAIEQPREAASEPAPQAPAARLRMTVTSGFYVRSLCHDLGIACNSLGLMSSLVRSRQADYELGKNVLEYSDLEAGPGNWEPTIRKQLEDFMEKEGWEAEEVEDEETWQANRKEHQNEKRESDRDRSYRGGNNKGSWRGKGKDNYSKNKDRFE